MELSTPLQTATAVLVIAGSGYDAKRRRNNRVLHTERDPDAVAHLAELVRALGDDAHAWMEWPTVSLVFVDTDGPVAELGVLGDAAWVRTAADGDRSVQRAGELRTWLTSVGVL